MRDATVLKVQTIAILSTLSVAILLLTSLFPLVYAAVPWTKYTGEVSLRDGIADELFVVDAWVLKDGSTYKMWYTHSRTDLGMEGIIDSLTTILSSELLSDFLNLDLAGLLGSMADIADTPAKMDALWNFMVGTTTVIGYATSSDGIDWNVVNDEVLAGASDTLESVGMPCVINDGGTYKMWFTHSETGLNKTGLQTILGNLDDGNPALVRDALIDLMDSTRSAIGYTTSADGGETWGNIQTGIFNGDGGGIWDSVATPCVINDGGIFKMWFTYAETDITATDIDDILDDITGFGVSELINILDNTNSVIGYTESADGITNWSSTSVALAGGGGVWDSVATPCVIYNGSGYEMWFTNFTTDLTPSSIQALFNEIQALETDILDLLDSYTTGGLTAFLEDFKTFLGDPDPDEGPPIPGDIDQIKAILANTSTIIGYTTSSDGITWDSTTEALAGSSGSPWSSVAFPCVVWEDGVYEMWFTQGVEFLTAQNVVSLLDGSILPIGYATFGQEIELVEGWNLMGLPLNPTSSATEDVLADILDNTVIVWAYDATTGNWSSFYYNPLTSQWTGTLTEMTAGKGYWIEMTAVTNLVVSGISPAMPFSIDLLGGWNLISIPEPTGSSATEDVLSGILGNVVIVWAYDATTGNWSSFYYNPLTSKWTGTLTEMTAGKGYWVELTTNDTLVIN